MTENQKKLIMFLHQYQSKNGLIPSLLEIVKGTGVSDNKSALRIIKALIRQGYLAQVGAKISAIIPTYKALKEMGLQPLEEYKIIGDAWTPKMTNNFDLNTVTTLQNDLTSLPSCTESTVTKIKTDGTQFDSNILKNIVNSYINLALTSYFQEKSPIIDYLKKIISNKRLEWTASAVILLCFSVYFLGQNYWAIVAACSLLLIYKLTNN